MSSRLDRHMEQLDKNREMLRRVEYCQEHGNECNDWEDNFLESIHNQLMKGIELSGREGGQLETLEKIEYVVEWGEKHIGRSLMKDELCKVNDCSFISC